MTKPGWILAGLAAAAGGFWYANGCKGFLSNVVQLPAFPGCAPAGGTPGGGTGAALMALESGGTPTAGSPSPFGTNPSNPPACAPGYVPQYIQGYGWTCLYVGYGGQSVVTQAGPTGTSTTISTIGTSGTTALTATTAPTSTTAAPSSPAPSPTTTPTSAPVITGVQTALRPGTTPAYIHLNQAAAQQLLGPGATIPSQGIVLAVPATLRGPSSVGLAETLANAVARGIGGQVVPSPSTASTGSRTPPRRVTSSVPIALQMARAAAQGAPRTAATTGTTPTATVRAVEAVRSVPRPTTGVTVYAQEQAALQARRHAAAQAAAAARAREAALVRVRARAPRLV
jgi:hypothetical protein